VAPIINKPGQPAPVVLVVGACLVRLMPVRVRPPAAGALSIMPVLKTLQLRPHLPGITNQPDMLTAQLTTGHRLLVDRRIERPL